MYWVACSDLHYVTAPVLYFFIHEEVRDTYMCVVYPKNVLDEILTVSRCVGGGLLPHVRSVLDFELVGRKKVRGKFKW